MGSTTKNDTNAFDIFGDRYRTTINENGHHVTGDGSSAEKSQEVASEKYHNSYDNDDD